MTDTVARLPNSVPSLAMPGMSCSVSLNAAGQFINTDTLRYQKKKVPPAGHTDATNKKEIVSFSSLSTKPGFSFLANNGNNDDSNKNSTKSNSNNGNKPGLDRAQSCPDIKYDECREFDAFAGEWVDSKAQTVLISPWGVIRYPSNAKLRFEAVYMGPNHLSVTFDKDPKRRKFVGKLNHDCNVLIWSNDTKWTKKGSKCDPRFQETEGSSSRHGSCVIQ